MSKIRVGTRASLLATTQTRLLVNQLQSRHPDFEVEEVLIKTEGDATTTPLSESKNPGVFVSALRDALLANQVDFIVHSMKDLPAKPFPGIVTAAIPERESVQDVLVSKDNLTLAQLPKGSLVGTSSPRRAASVRRVRPDLRVESIRGNVDSRIQKVRSGEYQGTLLALAGLNRIGRANEVAEVYSPDQMVPAPGQGALAVECREGDSALIELLASVDDPITRLTTAAEREVLVGLEAGCATAIGAFASFEDGALTLTAELAVEQTGESVSVRKQLVTTLSDLASARELGLQVASELINSEVAGRAMLR